MRSSVFRAVWYGTRRPVQRSSTTCRKRAELMRRPFRRQPFFFSRPVRGQNRGRSGNRGAKASAAKPGGPRVERRPPRAARQGKGRRVPYTPAAISYSRTRPHKRERRLRENRVASTACARPASANRAATRPAREMAPVAERCARPAGLLRPPCDVTASIGFRGETATEKFALATVGKRSYTPPSATGGGACVVSEAGMRARSSAG